MEERTIRVMLADDHNLVRAGIAQLLSLEADMEVVGEAADGLHAHALALELRPDIILMDLDMPRSTGFEAISRIKAELPETVVVVLTYSAQEKDIAEALRCGADGYLLKSLEPETLSQRIREALRGESPMSGAVTRKLLDDLFAGARGQATPEPEPAPAPVESAGRPQLTARELEIIALVAEGGTNREIGERLSVSENTVKNHLKHIMAKLQVENRAQAVAWAMREGLLGVNPWPKHDNG